MNTEFIFSLDENASAIDKIIDNLHRAVKDEDQALNALPKSLDGGLRCERHEEIISDLKEAIYSLTNAEICIRDALK